MNYLVTGASGFMGSHLVEALQEKGRVFALSRREPPPSRAIYVQADLSQTDKLRQLIDKEAPDVIFHLAAQSLVMPSWDDAPGTFDVNVGGTLNLLEAVRQSGRPCRLVVFSSSAIYATSERPIREDDPLEPSSPYGVSKLAVDHLARLYAVRYQMPVIRVRPFFVIGPRKFPDVTSHFSRGIVAVEKKKAEELGTGNLEAVRDFLDIRDAVRALLLLGESGRSGEAYNLSSGNSCRIEELLKILTGFSRVPVRVVQDPARMRPLDEPVKIGDNHKLKALGWKPEISLEASLQTILDYWRQTDAA